MLLLADVLLIVVGSNFETSSLSAHKSDLLGALCGNDMNSTNDILSSTPSSVNNSQSFYGGKSCWGFWHSKHDKMSPGVLAVAILEIGILLIFVSEHVLMIAALQGAYIKECVK
jgi:hypothetical protein